MSYGNAVSQKYAEVAGGSDSMPPTQLESGLHRIEGISATVRDLGDRLQGLGNRIFGAEPMPPQSAGTSKPVSVPNGLLEAMGDSLGDIVTRLNRIDELVARL